MAFRARIAQHIEIHRESRFPSLSPSAENRAHALWSAEPSLALPLTYLTQGVGYLSQPLPSSCRFLFYSRGTSAFASVATPFNLAPGPIPLCPHLIRLSLASDRFARTWPPFLSFPLTLRIFARVFAFHETPVFMRGHTPGFQSFLHLLSPRPAPSILIPSACLGHDRFTRASTFLSPSLSLSRTRREQWVIDH